MVRDRSGPAVSARRSCRLHDLDAALTNSTASIAKGAKAVAFSENPTVLGLPSVHTDHWDPLWERVRRAGHPGVHAHRQLVASW